MCVSCGFKQENWLFVIPKNGLRKIAKETSMGLLAKTSGQVDRDHIRARETNQKDQLVREFGPRAIWSFRVANFRRNIKQKEKNDMLHRSQRAHVWQFCETHSWIWQIANFLILNH